MMNPKNIMLSGKKTPNIEDYILYESIYLKFLEQAKP